MSRPVKRTYDNSLRTEQASATRERILDAIVQQFSDNADTSIAAVAERAGVSEPTIYRHFPNREALLAAAFAYSSARLGSPPPMTSIADLPVNAYAAALYMGRSKRWILGGIRNPAMHELRMAGRSRRLVAIRELLEPAFGELEVGDRDIAMAAFAAMQRAETWEYATTELMLSDEDAGRMLSFVVQALLEKLDRLKGSRATTLVPDDIADRARALDAAQSAAATDGEARGRPTTRADRGTDGVPRPSSSQRVSARDLASADAKRETATKRDARTRAPTAPHRKPDPRSRPVIDEKSR